MSVFPILGCFFRASASEKSEGLQWYNNANSRAIAISEQYETGLDKVCGVIAALSPNNRWTRNLHDAERLIEVIKSGGDDDDLRQLKVSTFGANKAKAVKILREPGPDVMSILGGRKTQAFFACILNPRRKDYVCVDGHAYSIWLGERVPTTRTPKISAKLYAQISEDYKEAASIINAISLDGQQYTPAEVQAITWVTWRNLHASLGRYEEES
jgi:hypothetical protein